MKCIDWHLPAAGNTSTFGCVKIGNRSAPFKGNLYTLNTMSLIRLIPSPKDESVEVEDIGVGRSSSDRLVTFETSDSVSELSLSRLLHREGHG